MLICWLWQAWLPQPPLLLLLLLLLLLHSLAV
jgi:hypothetical protein